MVKTGKIVNHETYSLYRRRSSRNVIVEVVISLDNIYVVPNNPELIFKY